MHVFGLLLAMFQSFPHQLYEKTRVEHKLLVYFYSYIFCLFLTHCLNNIKLNNLKTN